jgi:replicative DNA helicase
VAISGAGKTSWAINIIYNFSKQKKKELFFSLEMSKKEIINRLISREGKIKSDKLRTGNFTENDFKKIFNSAENLYEYDLYIDDNSNQNVYDILNKSTIAKELYNIDYIVIDYLQFLKPSLPNKDIYENTEENMRVIKKLADELNIPIIVLAQFNRQTKKNSNIRPTMSDIRGGSIIENTANVVMILERPDFMRETIIINNVYNNSKIEVSTENLALISIDKNRAGKSQITVPFKVDWSCYKFNEYFKF